MGKQIVARRWSGECLFRGFGRCVGLSFTAQDSSHHQDFDVFFLGDA